VIFVTLDQWTGVHDWPERERNEVLRAAAAVYCPDKKMAGSARCSIQALPEFRLKPELQDHKKENSMGRLREAPYRHLTSALPES